MLEFYGTGKFKQDVQLDSNFKKNNALKGDAATMYERNFLDPYQFQMKQPLKNLHPNQIYSNNYQNLNNYDQKYFDKHRNQASNLPNQDGLQPDVNPRHQSLVKPSHLNNWKIVKERQFAEQVKKTQEHPGQIVTKDEFYKSDRQIEDVKQKKPALERSNLYEISRPLLRVNTDLKTQTYIKNVQVVSEDTPGWCQTNNKFYNPEHIQNLKKQRKIQVENTDIFGNKIAKFDKNDQQVFKQPPPNGVVHEPTRMIILYEKPDVLNKHTDFKTIHKGNIRLQWPEETKKQHYEYDGTKKIGGGEKMFIKELEMKRTGEWDKIVKIGETEHYSRKEKDKPIQLKIGHGSASTLNPIKY